MSNPSLILPQSPAYGEDYVYAAQVEDGAVPLYNVLPLTFTRASGGTRINKDGLVQNMPYNLAQQSNTFSTSPWANANTTLTSGQSDPNGGSNAWKVEFSAGNAYLYQPGIVVTGVVTMSAYLRADSTTTIGFNDGSAYPNSVTIGTTWQRYTFSFNVTGTTTNIQFDNYFGVSPANQAKTFYLYGAQLNIGSTAQPYLATTDRLNMPRITYPVGGGCGALLLEKQSTNQILYSEQFNDASWTKNVSVTANAIISPDGTQNADKILESASNVQQWVYQSPSMTGAQTGTIYAKKGERNYIAMATAGLDPSFFNLDTGVVVSTASGATASITSVGNGWYRCSVSSPSIVGGTFFIVWISYDGVNRSYAGDTSKGVYVWGAQNEASSYATSYIPTTSTSATRIVDVCSKTGISNLIGQTEGTLYIDCNIFGIGAGQGILTLYGAVGGNVIIIYKQSDNILKLFVLTSGTLQINFGNTVYTGRTKIAVAYKNNDFSMYVNGSQIGTSSSGSVPSCSNMYIGADDSGTQNASCIINETIIYQTRLTNAELQSLTS